MSPKTFSRIVGTVTVLIFVLFAFGFWRGIVE